MYMAVYILCVGVYLCRTIGRGHTTNLRMGSESCPSKLRFCTRVMHKQTAPPVAENNVETTR